MSTHYFHPTFAALLLLSVVACSDSTSTTPDAGDASTTDAQQGCQLGGPGPASEFLYVGNATTNDLTVVDPRTCRAVGTIPLATSPTEATASADGRWVFVTAGGTNEVVVIDTQSNTVKTRVPVGTKPCHMFANPDHTKLWVGNDNSANVSVLDVASQAVERTIATGAGHHKMAMVPGSPYGVYVSNIVDSTIAFVGGDDTVDSATIAVGPSPHGMDYSSVSKRVYNCSAASQPDAGTAISAGIDVIATDGAQANTVTGRIALTARCNYLYFEPTGRFGWASVPTNDTVVVIDASNDSIAATIGVGTGPDKIRFVAGGLVAIANTGSADVSLVDATTHAEVARVATPMGMMTDAGMAMHRAIAPSLDGAYVYAVNADDDSISIIDIAARAIRGTVKVGGEPAALAVAGPSGGGIYPR